MGGIEPARHHECRDTADSNPANGSRCFWDFPGIAQLSDEGELGRLFLNRSREARKCIDTLLNLIGHGFVGTHSLQKTEYVKPYPKVPYRSCGYTFAAAQAVAIVSGSSCASSSRAKGMLAAS